MKDPIALSSYETFGAGYANAIEANAYNAHFERPSTLALLPEVRGKRVLDAGCGPGVYSRLLGDRGALVTGVDVSPAMLDLARERCGSAAEFHLHDLAQPLTQFVDSSFDLVLSSLAIHYVEEQEPLFREFFRVLAPGGFVVLSTHHPMLDFADSPSGNYFVREILDQEWDTIGKPVRVRFYRRPLSAVTASLTSAGFVIEALTEGVISDALVDKFPEVAERLARKPQFLFFRLRKPAFV